jgi:hypothetical protein
MKPFTASFGVKILLLTSGVMSAALIHDAFMIQFLCWSFVRPERMSHTVCTNMLLL